MNRLPSRPALVALALGFALAGCSSSGATESGRTDARPCDDPTTDAGAVDSSRVSRCCAIPVAPAVPLIGGALAQPRRSGRARASGLSGSSGSSAPMVAVAPAASIERTIRLPSAAASLPDAELADVGAELDPDAERSDRVGYATLADSLPRGSPAVATAVVPERPTGLTGPTASAAPAPTMHVRDTGDLRAWARAELTRAATALAARDYAAARAILAAIKAKAPGAAELREADKGEVAIYNLRKVDETPLDVSLRARARSDLRNTVWSSLFT